MDKKSGRAHRTVNCRRALRPPLGPFARGKHDHTKFDYGSRGGSHNQLFLGPVVLRTPCKTHHLLLPHNLQHKYTTLSLIDVFYHSIRVPRIAPLSYMPVHHHPLWNVFPVPLVVQQQEQDPTNLYIANLPPNYKETDLETLLSKHGQVISTRILRDQQGLSKGVYTDTDIE